MNALDFICMKIIDFMQTVKQYKLENELSVECMLTYAKQSSPLHVKGVFLKGLVTRNLYSAQRLCSFYQLLRCLINFISYLSKDK